MRHFLFFLFFLFSFSLRAESITKDSYVVHFLTRMQKMSLAFEKTKTIPDIEKSFKSYGFFQFEKNKGIIIKEEKPYSYVFVSTREKYCLQDRSDFLKNLPHFSDIKSVVDHMLDGDFSDLSKIFDIVYSEKNNLWQMEMKPSNKDIKKIIQKILLNGDRDSIKKIIIEYADGTSVVIDCFSTQQDLSHEIEC